MNARTILAYGLKLTGLTIAAFVCLAVGSSVTGLYETRTLSPAQASATLLATLGVCVIYAITLAYPIARSRWSGLKLMATMVLVYYGMNTFMSQIESAVFLSHVLPEGMLPKLFINGAIVGGLLSPVAVLIMGALRPREASEENMRLVMPAPEWAWRMLVCALLYLVLYYSFGYFIAWQNPEVRALYAGLEMPAWLPLFQLLRGLMWTALTLPVTRMMKGPWWHAGIANGLLMSMLMNAALLFPNNPIMADSVRMSHFIETATSNFVFGFAVTWLLTRPPIRVMIQAHATE